MPYIWDIKAKLEWLEGLAVLQEHKSMKTFWEFNAAFSESISLLLYLFNRRNVYPRYPLSAFVKQTDRNTLSKVQVLCIFPLGFTIFFAYSL